TKGLAKTALAWPLSMPVDSALKKSVSLYPAPYHKFVPVDPASLPAPQDVDAHNCCVYHGRLQHTLEQAPAQNVLRWTFDCHGAQPPTSQPAAAASLTTRRPHLQHLNRRLITFAHPELAALIHKTFDYCLFHAPIANAKTAPHPTATAL